MRLLICLVHSFLSLHLVGLRIHQCPNHHIHHMVLQVPLHMVPCLILLHMVLHQLFLEEVHIHHPLVLIQLLFMELHPVS